MLSTSWKTKFALGNLYPFQQHKIFYSRSFHRSEHVRFGDIFRFSDCVMKNISVINEIMTDHQYPNLLIRKYNCVLCDDLFNFMNKMLQYFDTDLKIDNLGFFRHLQRLIKIFMKIVPPDGIVLAFLYASENFSIFENEAPFIKSVNFIENEMRNW